MLEFEVKDFRELSGIGDSLVNLIYSLALSNTLKRPVGKRAPNYVLSKALAASNLRELAGKRVDRSEMGDVVEALIFDAWIKNRITLEACVVILAENLAENLKCPEGSNTRRDAREIRDASIQAFAALLKFIGDRYSTDTDDKSDNGDSDAGDNSGTAGDRMTECFCICNGHKAPAVAVDAVVRKGNRILLIKRKRGPFKGKFALPGGFVECGETTKEAIIREVKEETAVDIEIEGLLGVYSNPERDPRGHVISICYTATVIGEGKEKGGDDAEEAVFVDIEEINTDNLAFDHFRIINEYLEDITGDGKCFVKNAGV